jgi:hypothetical protein
MSPRHCETSPTFGHKRSGAIPSCYSLVMRMLPELVSA